MDTVSQASIHFNTQSVNTPELNDRLNINDLDFMSMLLKSKPENGTSEKPKNIYSKETETLEKNEKKSHLHYELNAQTSNLGGHLSNKIQIDSIYKSPQKSNEDINTLVSPKINKTQKNYLHAGQSHVSTKKELYEQSAFAINKLSYLDVLHNEGNFTNKKTIKNISNNINYFDTQNGKAVVTDRILDNQQPSLTFKTIVNQASDQDIMENKAINNVSTQLFNNSHLIEKSRVMITSFKNEEHLYIRDHFATKQQLDFTIKNILGSLKQTISKIFVNGKEK